MVKRKDKVGGAGGPETAGSSGNSSAFNTIIALGGSGGYQSRAAPGGNGIGGAQATATTGGGGGNGGGNVSFGYGPGGGGGAGSAGSRGDPSGNPIVAGGASLANKAVTQDNTNNKGVFDADDVTWSTSTITARGAVLYKSTGTASTSALICYIDFGSDKSSAGGNFTIQWNASGILTLA